MLIVQYAFSEGLGGAPVIKLSCGHIFHHKCLETRLNTKWITPKITFAHIKCSQCLVVMDAPNNNDILKLINESKEMFEKVNKLLLERMKIEKIDQDPRLKDPKDPYFEKPMEFAYHRLSYYQCSKCNNPYFGGLRECRGGPGDNDNQDANKVFDKNELVCNKCVDPNGMAGVTKCKIHGTDYIDYKCRYCCELACWFCFGTTHFCDKCHGKAYELPKLPKDKLPKCDKKTCLINHPPNGDEYALGCSLCRYKHN